MKSGLSPAFVIAVVAGGVCVAQTSSPQNAGDSGNASRPAATVEVDASRATRTYANFSRITGTPEELIIDFGLNPQPTGIPAEPIVIDQRIIMNFYTAKRFAAALQMSIERHEQVFGPIETDINQRLRKTP